MSPTKKEIRALIQKRDVLTAQYLELCQSVTAVVAEFYLANADTMTLAEIAEALGVSVGTVNNARKKAGIAKIPKKIVHHNRSEVAQGQNLYDSETYYNSNLRGFGMLPVRVINMLNWLNHKYDLTTPDDLATFTRAEILETPNIGKKSIEFLEAVLAENGLAFRDD